MLNLLMPVDGSQGAEKAAHYVVALGGLTASLRVHILNVQPRMEAWEVARFLKPEEVGRWQQQCGEDQTAFAVRTLAGAGIDYTVSIVAGDVTDTIVQHLCDHGCDLIVMGTRGLGTVEGLLLGSVASAVIRRAAVPVTLVR